MFHKLGRSARAQLKVRIFVIKKKEAKSQESVCFRNELLFETQ